MTIRINKPQSNAADSKAVTPASIALSGRTYTEDEFDFIGAGMVLVRYVNWHIKDRQTLENGSKWMEKIDEFNKKAWEFENGK